MDLDERCQPIELVLSDVDGVLTDGRVVLDSRGIETKRFHIRDGMGIALWQKAGYRFAMVTRRSSQAVKIRAAELGVEIVRQGADDKLAAARQILDELGLSFKQACYVGDDLPDIPVMRRVGVPVAVANCRPEVKNEAAYVTRAEGGSGAAREVAEKILKDQGKWDTILSRYYQDQKSPV